MRAYESTNYQTYTLHFIQALSQWQPALALNDDGSGREKDAMSDHHLLIASLGSKNREGSR
jgi:hypothetical protein